MRITLIKINKAIIVPIPTNILLLLLLLKKKKTTFNSYRNAVQLAGRKIMIITLLSASLKFIKTIATTTTL